jgi:DNA modification methylase
MTMGLALKATPIELAARQDLFVGSPTHIDPENWDFFAENTQYLLHNLHSYPARFIPQIPKRAIERWSSPGEIVLDPFCGCGTALLEALLAGRRAIGVDNNGVAILISHAKIQRYKAGDFRALEKLIARVESWLAGEEKAFIRSAKQYAPKYENREKWFSDEAIRDLSALRAAIHQLPVIARVLGLAVFSHIIVLASRQDSDTRYAAVERSYRPRWAWEAWARKMKEAVQRALETSSRILGPKPKLIRSDCRSLKSISSGTVQLIVTSPPYLNAYDYHKYHRHRLHWTGQDVAFARNLEIGNHDTFTRRGATPHKYFADMQQCFEEWRRVLRPGGRAFVAIGDSIVSGKFVPVAETFVEMCCGLGFRFERRWIRQVETTRKSFNHGARIKREHLLLFEKL